MNVRMHASRSQWSAAVFLAGAFATLTCGADGNAATITASSFDDVVANDGSCSLREAITAVNTHAASGARLGECIAGDGNDDTIVLAAGTYYLTITGSDEANNASGDLDLRANMKIAGSDTSTTIIDANLLSASQIPDRVMHVIGSSVQVSLQDLVITGGHAPDGVFGSTGEPGGGILVENASLTTARVLFFGNAAGRGGDARSNTDAGGNGGDGGAISASNATLTLTDSDFTYDHGGNAGAFAPSFFLPTSSHGGGGGAISLRNASALTLLRSTLRNNGAGSITLPPPGVGGSAFGGALLVDSNSSATVTQANFDQNYSDGTFGVAIGVTGGGSLELSQSSVTRNSGGYSALVALNAAPLRLSNDTIAANVNGQSGVVVQGSQLDMDFVTVSGNSQGIVAQASAVVRYRNSIVSGNDSSDCSVSGSTFVSEGYSLVGSGCPSDAIGDIATADPLLGALTDNGGFGQTMLPLPQSPATNAGNCAASSISVDQRNHARPATVPGVADVFDGCDIGAVELDDDIFWDDFEE